MSYSVQVTVDLSKDVDRQLQEAFEEKFQTDENLRAADAAGHLSAAKAHVLNVLTTIARPTDRINVGIHGHVNPSLDENPGWASNQMTVSVTQAYGPPPEPEPEEES